MRNKHKHEKGIRVSDVFVPQQMGAIPVKDDPHGSPDHIAIRFVSEDGKARVLVVAHDKKELESLVDVLRKSGKDMGWYDNAEGKLH